MLLFETHETVPKQLSKRRRRFGSEHRRALRSRVQSITDTRGASSLATPCKCEHCPHRCTTKPRTQAVLNIFQIAASCRAAASVNGVGVICTISPGTPRRIAEEGRGRASRPRLLELERCGQWPPVTRSSQALRAHASHCAFATGKQMLRWTIEAGTVITPGSILLKKNHKS